MGQKTYDDKNFYNSILVFDKNGNVYLYHKEKLFPIIERLTYSKFKNKNLNNNYFSIQNLNFILSSCVEIEDSNLFNKNLKNEPNLIINLGSEYSLTKNASKYSLTLARFKAIEKNKFLIKATKNGYSAIISPLGEIIKQTLDKNKNNYLLLGEIYLINGKTLYSKIGDDKILIISFLIVFFSLKSLYIFSQSQKRNK
jgi:apolipoprotein N-acyltransferase